METLLITGRSASSETALASAPAVFPHHHLFFHTTIACRFRRFGPRGSQALQVKTDQEALAFSWHVIHSEPFFCCILIFCRLKMASRIIDAFKEHPILQQTHLVFYVRETGSWGFETWNRLGPKVEFLRLQKNYSLRIQTPPGSNRIEGIPIPSEKNRNVGVIPFLRHTWILGDFGQIIKYMNTCKSKTIKIIGPPELLIVNTY